MAFLLILKNWHHKLKVPPEVNYLLYAFCSKISLFNSAFYLVSFLHAEKYFIPSTIITDIVSKHVYFLLLKLQCTERDLSFLLFFSSSTGNLQTFQIYFNFYLHSTRGRDFYV